MGIKDEITEGLISKIATYTFRPNETQRLIMDRWATLTEPSRRVRFKRMLPRKQKFLDRLIDMTVFFTEITAKEPTRVFMGWAQQHQLQDELQSLHMIMMPHKGYAGRLLNMDVIFVLEDSRLEVTC